MEIDSSVQINLWIENFTNCIDDKLVQEYRDEVCLYLRRFKKKEFFEHFSFLDIRGKGEVYTAMVETFEKRKKRKLSKGERMLLRGSSFKAIKDHCKSN